MIGIDGCVDVMSTFLIFVINQCTCANQLEQSNLWKIRILFGLVMSIVDFIVICILNKDDYLDDEVRTCLFIFIICYIVIGYGVFIVLSCFTCSTLFVKIYKISDIVLDAFLITYTFVIAGAVNEPFEIVCAVIVAIDILLDFMSLFNGCGKFSIKCIVIKIIAKLPIEDN